MSEPIELQLPQSAEISAGMSTRARIFLAAVDLFSVAGYGSVSIREITRAVDIKESSFYNHFTSKEALLEEILGYFRREYHKLMPSLDEVDQLLEVTTPTQFWRAGIERFKTIMSTPLIRKLNRILAMEQYRTPLAREIVLHDVIEKPLAFTEAVFRRMIERKQIKPFDPHVLAVAYQMPIYSLSLEYLALDCAGLDVSGVEQQMEAHLQFFTEVVSHKKA